MSADCLGDRKGNPRAHPREYTCDRVGGSISYNKFLGFGALVVLAVHERGAAEPTLPLKLWRNRVIAVGSFSGFTGCIVMMSINGFLPVLCAGGDGPQPGSGRDGARRCVGQLDLCQPRRRPADDPHLLPARRDDRRRLVDRRHRRADHPRAGEPPAVGRHRLAADRHRHGVLQHRLPRLDPGERRLERARRSHLVDHVMRIVGNSVGAAVFGAILNFGVSRRIPEAGDAVNRLLQPAARHGLGARRDCPGQRRDRRWIAQRLHCRWSRRDCQPCAGAGIADAA